MRVLLAIAAALAPPGAAQPRIDFSAAPGGVGEAELLAGWKRAAGR
jgi:hypothetical protein